MLDYIIIHEDDLVAVALKDIEKGFILNVSRDNAKTIDNINCDKIMLLDNIPAGHKFALRDIREGELAIKYGHPIGYASCDIPRGSLVHTSNLTTSLGEVLSYSYKPDYKETVNIECRNFMGYRRKEIGRASCRERV